MSKQLVVMMKRISTLLLLVGAAPALAQPAAATPKEKASDSNRIVCERYEEIGSRLSSRRVCKTVREWEEQRNAQRGAVERAQQNKGIDSSN